MGQSIAEPGARVGRMEFGSVQLGDSDALSVVTASLPDGRSWIVSQATPRLDEEAVLRCAAAVAANARRRATAAEGALTDDQRDAEFSRISTRRLEIERAEEALIVAAEWDGRAI